MIYITWILSLVAVFLLGYFSREIIERIKKLETEIKKTLQPTEDEESPSVLIDPDNIEAQVRWEHKQNLKKLNG